MCLIMHYVLDYSVREIGSVLGVPRGTVLSRLARGRERLARVLSRTR